MHALSFNRNYVDKEGFSKEFLTEAYSEPSWASRTDLFAKLVNTFDCFWKGCSLEFLVGF